VTVAIVGATASGKSDLAMAAAAAVAGVEIVAADAMQVYRGMDIGTAKPTSEDRRAVTHHCLDLVEPSAVFTLADYQPAGLDAMAGITARGGSPLLVAGTGLYLAAVVDRLELPGVWPEIRADLEAQSAVEPGGLYKRLQSLDPAAATRMEPTNIRRIVRALEVCLGSGRPFSSFGPGMESYPPSQICQIGLRWNRAVLGSRIEARVRRMMDAGLLAEVSRLAAGPEPLSRTAAQALGYKELIDHLAGRLTLPRAVESVIIRTRQFATRQDRWFRRDPRIRWIDIETDALEALPALVEALRR